MVNKSPSLVFFPFQMAVSWLTNGSDPDHLLTGDFGPTLFGVAPYLPARKIFRQASVSGLVSSNRKLHCPPYLIDRWIVILTKKHSRHHKNTFQKEPGFKSPPKKNSPSKIRATGFEKNTGKQKKHIIDHMKSYIIPLKSYRLLNSKMVYVPTIYSKHQLYKCKQIYRSSHRWYGSHEILDCSTAKWRTFQNAGETSSFWLSWKN